MKIFFCIFDFCVGEGADFPSEIITIFIPPTLCAMIGKERPVITSIKYIEFLICYMEAINNFFATRHIL